MKYIKNFEGIRSEFPGMFAPLAEEDNPKNVPGFENGTIDPYDDEVYGEPVDEISQKEQYKTFLKLVKERNFEETEDEIKINLYKLSQDFCMTIYSFQKHLHFFLLDELKGKYISDGFYNILKDEDNIEGIIENVYSMYYDDEKCSILFNLKLKGIPTFDDTSCKNIITIDKLKSSANKYNIG